MHLYAPPTFPSQQLPAARLGERGSTAAGVTTGPAHVGLPHGVKEGLIDG